MTITQAMIKPAAHENELADCTAIIVAAGSGSRAGSPPNDDANKLGSDHNQEKQSWLEKQFWPLAGKTVLAHSVDLFQAHLRVKTIIIVTSSHNVERVRSQFGENNCHVTQGGATRQQSVYAGLQTAADIDPAARFVAIHDAARPLLPARLLSTMLATINDAVAGVAPALPIADTLSYVNAQQHLDRIIDRAPIRALQTPQVFWREAITDLHKRYADDPIFTDDCGLALASGHAIATVDGAHQLLKLTHAQDYAMLKAYCGDADGSLLTAGHGMPDIRIGNGFDVHKFTEGNSVLLLGIKIPFKKSLEGHSDADVGFHSIVDAILGSIGKGDIGEHFPPTEKKWKNKNSLFFLQYANNLLQKENFTINNLDITLICEKPKIINYKQKMKKKISQILKINIDLINIKGTTTENLGFLGREEGIACQSIITVSKKNDFNF